MSTVAEPLTVEVIDPKQKLELEVASVRTEVKAISITNDATYRAAAASLVRCASVRKKIEEYWKPLKAAAHAAHKALTEAEAKMIAEMAGDERTLRLCTSAWETEQERIRQQKIRAEQERQRIEQERLQREADAENERRRVEAQKQADDERLAMAAQIQEQGATAEEIEQVLAAPVVVQDPVYVAPMVAVAPPVPQFQRAAGLTAARKNWKAQVTNIVELAAYVVANPQFANLIQGNEQALNAMAKANEANLSLPGVRAFNDATSVGVRR